MTIRNAFPRPLRLEECDPRQRGFPDSWKTAYWRRSSAPQNGYKCPICEKVFKGSLGFEQLEADHIDPYSNGGLTVWENMQLLCKVCNSKKSNNG